MSTPSMTIFPADGSMIRNKPRVRDDLPAPVRPTMPTCQQANITTTLSYLTITHLLQKMYQKNGARFCSTCHAIWHQDTSFWSQSEQCSIWCQILVSDIGASVVGIIFGAKSIFGVTQQIIIQHFSLALIRLRHCVERGFFKGGPLWG